MSVSTRSVGSALSTIVGASHVTDDPAALATAAIDGRAPRWVVTPQSVDDVSRVVALAHDADLAVIPRGSGSHLELGHPPARLDAVIDLRGLSRIVEHSPEDLTVTVEAGVTGGALAAVLAAHRQFLPVDAPGAAGRTLGGMVAINAIGLLRGRYGSLRDLVLGVRFVQADGVVTWGGAKVVKSVTGYDVPKLLVGSLGTLGVIAELTLRLHPRSECERTWVVGFASAQAACAFARSVLDSSIQPVRLQFANTEVIEYAGGSRTPAAIAVSIGSVEAAVTEQGQRLRALGERAGGTVRASDETWWKVCDRLLHEGRIVLRVAVPASDLGDTADEISRVLGAETIVTACAATGAFTVVIANRKIGAAPRAVEALRSFVGPLGGHVTILKGPRSVRRAVDPWGPIDPPAFALMRGLKETFDPTGTLSPGRFVGGL